MSDFAKENYTWFLSIIDKIIDEHYKEYAVISNNLKIVAYYKDFNTAYYETLKSRPLGTFTIQQVVTPQENTIYVY